VIDVGVRRGLGDALTRYESLHGLRPPGIHEMLAVTRRARSPFFSWR
jgi:hypothetical protein